jgi:diguanylate cyclase (GGDEF)-like protein
LCVKRAEAHCLPYDSPEITRLQEFASRDPSRALEQTRTALAQLERDPSASPSQRAALYAAQAHAYSLLELDHEARKSAALGLALAPALNDPVHLDLLMVDAENVYDQAGLNSAIERIEGARASQKPGSIAQSCLLITLGVLKFRQDRAAESITHLLQAYRSSNPGTELRMLAAEALSSVMRGMGDYAQALELNQEVIDWQRSKGATLSLSVSRFLRGNIFTELKDYRSAIAELEAARAISVTLADEQGIAFADMDLCDAEIELGHLPQAELRCADAARRFEAAGSTDVVKRTQVLQARIDLSQSRAQRALARLDEVLAHGGADVPARQLASAYQLRSRANAALGRYEQAYKDLNEYASRYVAASEAERVRQGVALRARFGTDREIERNASLKRDLAFARELAQRQREHLRWTVVGIGAGVLVIALLTYILLANLRHRRELQRLANVDALTGLANRRRTVALASAALSRARSEYEPVTIALLDLDHFKAINDRCGHAAGDAVLREFATRASRYLRASDVLGRWGGEEFLLVLPDTSLDTAVASLERLRLVALDIPLPPNADGLRVSLSAGLATNEAGLSSLDEIVARADAALYAAKADGRNLVRIAQEHYLTASTAVRRALRERTAAR